MAPSMDPSEGDGGGVAARDGHIDLNSELDDLFGLEDAGNPEPNHYQNIMREVSSPELDTPNLASASIPIRREKRVVDSSSNPRGGKRNIRQSTESTMFQQYVSTVEETSKKIIDMLEADAIAEKPKEYTNEVMKVIDQMVQDGLLELDSPLWCYSVTALVNKDLSSMFLSITRNLSRNAWLDWQFTSSGGQL